MQFRTERVNALLQSALGGILRKYYREEATAITLSRVATSPDLRYAAVTVSLLGDEAVQKKAWRWLRRKKSELRRRLSQEVVLKFSPELRFVIDDSQQRELRIASLLAEIADENLVDKDQIDGNFNPNPPVNPTPQT
ncbi:MAG: 30S ribosome-binding factor RbfA [Puniceicoccales bacterium]|jgi:ribosome-binding factor A|nr:30S ribosome-binding factor RbfA [Puniceicoccales bacterium]